jgi:hypothetical protein
MLRRVPESVGGEVYYDDGYYTDDYYFYPSAEPLVDENLYAEELVTLTAFQDNRFSSADPIYVTPENPDVEATGNLWLYADVPLQEPFGIDVDPLLGFVQGTCQGIFSNLDGYCSFTYEFFDGLEVIATMTVQGATQPTGPSILTVVGGTGDLEGVSGDVSLIPTSLDTNVTPPAIVEDNSPFLGNPDGYYMEAILYIRYSIAFVPDDGETVVPDDGETVAPVDDMLVDDGVMMDDLIVGEVPTASPVDNPTDEQIPPVDDLVVGDDVTEDDFVVTSVQCVGEAEPCDCTATTCALSPCSCEEAQDVMCCDGFGFVGK